MKYVVSFVLVGAAVLWCWCDWRLERNRQHEQSPVYQRQLVAKNHLEAFGRRCLALAGDLDKEPRGMTASTAQNELTIQFYEVLEELTHEGIDTGKIGQTFSEQKKHVMTGEAWRTVGQEALKVSQTFPK